MTASRTVTLRSTNDSSGSRYLGVRITIDGGLDIEGYDSGPAVRNSFGSSAYEWHHKVKMSDIPRLRAAMGIDSSVDLLGHIEANFNGPGQPDLETFIRSAGITFDFFNWISFDDLPGPITGG
ncbi:MAG: hypothetical protein ACKODY_01270 [Actinomycetota bacterium]